MNRWSRRAGAAFLMAAIWAVAWAPLGPLVGLVVDRDGSMDEPWILVAALPAFVSGAIFTVVLSIADRSGRFDELRPSRAVACGVVAGLLVGVLPFVLGDASVDGPGPLRLASMIVPPIVVMSALSAAVSLSLAKRGLFNVLDPRTDPVARRS